MTPGEKLHLYAEAWREIERGKKGNVDLSDLAEVMEREAKLGFRPQEQYSHAGFKAISRSMTKYGLLPNDVRKFLEWKAKNENAKKARASKPLKKVKKNEDRDRFFEEALKEVKTAKTNSGVAKSNAKKSNAVLNKGAKPKTESKNIEFTSADFE